jgi:hypothetical protein
MDEWTCGPKCPFWEAYNGAHGFNGLCREEHACNEGDECADTIDCWEADLRGVEEEADFIRAAIAARREVTPNA